MENIFYRRIGPGCTSFGRSWRRRGRRRCPSTWRHTPGSAFPWCKVLCDRISLMLCRYCGKYPDLKLCLHRIGKLRLVKSKIVNRTSSPKFWTIPKFHKRYSLDFKNRIIRKLVIWLQFQLVCSWNLRSYLSVHYLEFFFVYIF